jgi:uncharacterized membrane protein YraQ (UPF0718 family)
MRKIRLFLLSLPGNLQLVIIIGATMILAFGAAIGTRAFFDINQLAADKDQTLAVYTVLGTIYAILLAFVIAEIWENYREAVASIQTETDALMGIMYILGAFPAEEAREIRSLALSYAQKVIDEWEALGRVAREKISPMDLSFDAAITMVHAIQTIQPANDRETAIFEQAMIRVNTWLDARRERLQSAKGGNAAPVWPLLVIGALVLFAFHGLFDAKSIEVWAVALLGLSAVVGLSFYLIFSLDSPFTGSLSAHVGPFQWVIDSWQRDKTLGPDAPVA